MPNDELPGGNELETSRERTRFVIQMLAWIVGTYFYAAFAYYLLATASADRRFWIAAGAVALYFLAAGVFSVNVARSWLGRRRRV